MFFPSNKVDHVAEIMKVQPRAPAAGPVARFYATDPEGPQHGVHYHHLAGGGGGGGVIDDDLF